MYSLLKVIWIKCTTKKYSLTVDKLRLKKTLITFTTTKAIKHMFPGLTKHFTVELKQLNSIQSIITKMDICYSTSQIQNNKFLSVLL